MSTTAAFENVHRDAEYFEYSKAADPIGLKLISRVPYHDFPASLYKDGPTRIIPLDLSKELGVDYPATGPGLLAHFVRVVRGEQQSLNPVATSQLLYVLAGKGTVTQGTHEIEFTEGAFVALPGGIPANVRAATDTALYYVNDAPLLSYLGAGTVSPRFEPTLYPATPRSTIASRCCSATSTSRRLAP
jgi:mannose-6-phosphate isomerase-like protein (cupin superfamily)